MSIAPTATASRQLGSPIATRTARSAAIAARIIQGECLWATSGRACGSGEPAVNVEGEHYRVEGGKPGPPPAHPIRLFIGAYGPRMLRLTGRLGDGWLPTLGGNFIRPEDAPPMHAAVDEG